MTVNEKIEQLRRLMKVKGIKAYIIPSSDPHISEYPPDHWKARSWFSGFTGSAGTVVVTEDECGLWTDGRYFLQAERQLEGSEIKLFKMGLPETPSHIEWIAKKLQTGDTVGFSGEVVSVETLKEMRKKFEAKDLKIDVSNDFIDEIWRDRPDKPATTVTVHDISYTGLSAAEKIDKVRLEMKKTGADYYIISTLDDIAWLFNIRANDIAYVPVAVSHALISADNAVLFINRDRVSSEAAKMLADNNIIIEDYEEAEKMLGRLQGGLTAYDPAGINCRTYEAIAKTCRKLEIENIVARLKAVKNETEIANIRNSQIKDGIAMVQFLHWLDTNIDKETITELDISEKLEYFRRLQDKNMGPSFDTIAGYADHGAVIHYKASEESRYVIKNKGLLVIDSGGQYLDGTTDITRTVVFNDPTDEEKRNFTFVLKAHIALAKARFLYGTTGSNLDIIARYPLWIEGLNYRHGTGHGVGYYLTVHEGPQNISQSQSKVRLEPGMLLTDEPGLYAEGKHGIRTENMLLVTEDQVTDFGRFLKFEVLTWCPIDLRGIEPALLTTEEKDWLNTYHRTVYEKLSPHIDNEVREWLQQATRSI